MKMKLIVIKSLALFFFVNSLVACQSTSTPVKPSLSCSLPSGEKPVWVDNQVSENDLVYFGYGVMDGFGKSFPETRKLAISEARSELAELMSTQVTSKVIINNSRISGEEIDLVQSQMQTSLNTQSNLLLSMTTPDKYYSDSENCLIWMRVKLSKTEFELQKRQLVKVANAKLETILTQVNQKIDTLLVNDVQQNQKLNVIVKNTTKTAVENLLADYGIQFTPVGFMEAMFTINDEQVDDVLLLFKKAEFDTGMPMTNYPDCMGYSSMYGPQDPLRKKQTTFFKISNNLTVATCVTAMGLENVRIKRMLEILEFDVERITGFSKLYMGNWLSNSFTLQYGQEAGPNPAGVFDINQSFNTSLISYLKPKKARINLDRGGYTLFHLAAIFDRDDLVTSLLDLGFDEQKKSKSGYTPLALAIEHGSYNFINKAIQLGFHKQDRKGIAFTTSLLKALSYVHSSYHARNGTMEGVEIYNTSNNPMFKIAKSIKPKSNSVLNKSVKIALKAYKSANEKLFKKSLLPSSLSNNYWTKDDRTKFSAVNAYINYLNKM
jgi:ankyrin repeat protein